MKTLLFVTALGVYAANYHICTWLFPGSDPESLTNWYTHKHALLSLSFALIAIGAMIEGGSKMTLFTLCVIAALALNDTVDRIVFHTRELSINDLFVVPLIIILYQWKKLRAAWQKRKKT